MLCSLYPAKQGEDGGILYIVNVCNFKHIVVLWGQSYELFWISPNIPLYDGVAFPLPCRGGVGGGVSN